MKAAERAPKPKPCKSCRTMFVPFSTLAKVCSPVCALALVRKDTERLDRARLNAAKKAHRADKERIKTLETLCSEVQRDINKLVMEIYRDEDCISCGSPNTTEAGHYFHAGSKYRCSRFRFDIRGIRPQCCQCNRHSGGGNQHGYRLGYIARYGIEAFEELEEAKRIADRGELAPLTKDEVKRIGIDARRQLRKLQAERLPIAN